MRRQWHPTPVRLPGKSHGWRSLVGYSPRGRWESDTTERLHFHFHALEKEMATHSSVLAWRVPGTGEPGGLPSMGSHRVGRDLSDLAAAAAWAFFVAQLVKRSGFDPWFGKILWRREWLPTLVFWPAEFHGLYGVSNMTERVSLSLFSHKSQPFSPN